ncbi:cyclic nucleotide-binding protein [Rivularia sp. PCC 7116]|uniref:Crp/Fnr family transcriptional regulator n=1 Tax=Rivularia sp. PCC 7116 TaxID=373994 RepID=UPI00029ED651|nr:Crp/Fnr family transcriptional regulator [Rivularia sp. PCC 7116]AFY58919.1 cyclic nucleotide-binding protein [Rivularia sp. PCC 7116]
MDLTAIDSLPETLRNRITIQSLAPGETLFAQEDEALNLYVVISGRIKLVRYINGGQVSTFEIVRASESLAEVALFAEIYPCTAVAEIDSQVIAYPKEEFLNVLRAYPEMAQDFMAMLVRKIQSLKFRLELRDIRIAHERVLHYLRHLVNFPQETTIITENYTYFFNQSIVHQ